jgi:acyl-CoA synthetase (AMP-forming)/AMP-acid ligase II
LRFSFSNSRNRFRSSDVDSADSDRVDRYAFTQFRTVCPVTPQSRATSATARDFSTTSRAAASRNSGVKPRVFFCATNNSVQSPNLTLGHCPKSPGHLKVLFLDEIPKTATGKFSKQRLRSRYITDNQ